MINWFKRLIRERISDEQLIRKIQRGEVEGPMGDSPWGSYAGMFRDKYGIEWIIEYSSDK